MSTNKLELLRQRFAARTKESTSTSTSTRPDGTGALKKGKGSDVRAVVVSVKQRWGKPCIVCFIHSLDDAKPGECDRVENNRLVVKPRKASPDDADPDMLTIEPYQLFEVVNNSKKTDDITIGDAIWLCNLTTKAGTSRTFYDISFARRDYTCSGFSALTKSEHTLFYVPRFNPDSWDNDILLPVAPFPTDEANIRTPGVYAQMQYLDDNNFVQERDNTIFARFTLGVLQWKSDIEVDAVNVRLPNIRCWESTLSAFGIQTPSIWNALANTILRNVPFYLKGYVHKESTNSLLETTENSDADYALSVRVSALIVDPERMLRLVALRVPEDYARSILDRQNRACDIPKHAWNSTASNFFNASEIGANVPLPDADQWFVLPNIDALLGEKARLDTLSDAERQAWLESHMTPNTVACVFLRSTKKRSAVSAGL